MSCCLLEVAGGFEDAECDELCATLYAAGAAGAVDAVDAVNAVDAVDAVGAVNAVGAGADVLRATVRCVLHIAKWKCGGMKYWRHTISVATKRYRGMKASYSCAYVKTWNSSPVL